MAEYEYLARKTPVPPSDKIIQELEGYPVVTVRSDNTHNRVLVRTSEPLEGEEKEKWTKSCGGC